MTKKTLYQRLRDHALSCCISFTLVNVILSALNIRSELIVGNVWQANLEMFAVCFVIGLLMLIASLFRQEDGSPHVTPLTIGIELVCVAVPVLGLGGFVFHWFDPFSVQILYPIVILIAVYALTAAIFYFNAKRTERELNRLINARKERLHHDTENH